MTRFFHILLGKSAGVVCLLSFVLTLVFSQSNPHFDARDHLSFYHGPGREEPTPEFLPEIRVGYFGPTDPSDFGGEQVWLAAQLAFDDANREGGYEGAPFRLIPAWSESPWGSGIAQLARSIYEQELWAIVGSVDGPSTHLVEQLVAKARLTLINPASSDKTVNLANVPWMFSCLPGEHIQAPILAAAIAQAPHGPPLILSATDHDSRVFVKELKKHLSLEGTTPTYHFELDGGMSNLGSLIDQVLATRSKIVVVIAGVSATALVMKQLRQKRYDGQCFGGPNMGRTAYLTQAGPAAAGAIFPYLINLHVPADFIGRYQAEFGILPDYVALQTYDAVTLLVQAIRKAGLNRARICDAVRELSPWDGISGPIIWDSLGQNMRRVQLATIADARVVPFELHR